MSKEFSGECSGIPIVSSLVGETGLGDEFPVRSGNLQVPFGRLKEFPKAVVIMPRQMSQCVSSWLIAGFNYPVFTVEIHWFCHITQICSFKITHFPAHLVLCKDTPNVQTLYWCAAKTVVDSALWMWMANLFLPWWGEKYYLMTSQSEVASCLFHEKWSFSVVCNSLQSHGL